jgi:hypothetical protein
MAALDDARQFAYEISASTGEPSDEVKTALERCLAEGWVTIPGYGARPQLTPTGRSQLALRGRGGEDSD